MLCSNCGYENPRDHRYCGMCGTPFPYRALTVPGAQSTLSFASTTIEVAPVTVVEAVRRAPVEAEPAVTEPVAGQIPEPEPAVETPVATQAAEMTEPRVLSEAREVPVEELTTQQTLASVTRMTGSQHEPAPIMRAETFATEASPLRTPEVVDETPAAAESPAPPVQEPEQPIEPPAREPEPEEPAIREPEPEAPEVIREPPPVPQREPATLPQTAAVPPTITLAPPAPQPIAPRLRVKPPPRAARHETPIVAPQEMAKMHPPPDSLPISSPPESSGMPTFKEISEASGPPDISPFEPPKEKRTAQDRELEEFVANFRWTPPAETADELTMRSEVPVIDKEVPTEFHHPSFDDDVAPPPEAGPHPTGQEFYEPDGTAPRPRFLDVGDKSGGRPAASGESFMGLDHAPTQIPPPELAGGSKRRGWLWGTLLALVAIFGALGYLEGRAQSTHAFRGPVQFAREEYSQLRERLFTKAEPATVIPESRPAETRKPAEPQPQPDAAAQPANTQPDAAQQTQPDASPPAANTQPQDDTTVGAAKPDNGAPTETADTTPAKSIEAPPTKSASSKPQPGQQELAKALDASDSAAAAAWLWKSTSRGNPEAPVRLADMYIKGNGVTKSCEQALVLLRSAAIKENAPARNRLAALYANGTCVSRDRVKAYQLMSSALAVDPSSEWAKENRQQLWNQMTAEQRAEAEKVH